MKILQITVSFCPDMNDYLKKFIEIPDDLAEEKHIKNGETGVVSENRNYLKVSYRGSLVELPKDKIRVVEGLSK